MRRYNTLLDALFDHGGMMTTLSVFRNRSPKQRCEQLLRDTITLCELRVGGDLQSPERLAQIDQLACLQIQFIFQAITDKHVLPCAKKDGDGFVVDEEDAAVVSAYKSAETETVNVCREIYGKLSEQPGRDELNEKCATFRTTRETLIRYLVKSWTMADDDDAAQRIFMFLVRATEGAKYNAYRDIITRAFRDYNSRSFSVGRKADAVYWAATVAENLAKEGRMGDVNHIFSTAATAWVKQMAYHPHVLRALAQISKWAIGDTIDAKESTSSAGLQCITTYASGAIELDRLARELLKLVQFGCAAPWSLRYLEPKKNLIYLRLELSDTEPLDELMKNAVRYADDFLAHHSWHAVKLSIRRAGSLDSHPDLRTKLLVGKDYLND